jgi:hypothetical protein
MSPVKEPKFFALECQDLDFGGPGDQERMERGSITSFQNYCELFHAVSSESAIGEASTLYLYHSERSIERIRHYVPDVKIIAILRDPVDRAYSNFLHMIRNGVEPLNDFSHALGEEGTRIKNNWMPFWHYQNRGFYYAQLKPFFEAFDRCQIAVFLYEDLTTGSDCLMRNIFKFLSVDEQFVPDTGSIYNISGVPKNKVLHDFLMKPNPIKIGLKQILPRTLSKLIANKIRVQNLTKPPLPPEVRKELVSTYKGDILKLQDLIGRDLSKWLEC